MKAHVDEVGRDPSERKELCMGRTVTGDSSNKRAESCDPGR